MLTFTDESPPTAPAVWREMLNDLRNQPGRWAYIENMGRRAVDYRRTSWAGHPVDIVGEGLSEDRRTFERVWFRWNA